MLLAPLDHFFSCRYPHVSCQGPPGVVSMLPAIGLGTLLGAATGVVTMGTAVWIGAGTAAGGVRRPSEAFGLDL